MCCSELYDMSFRQLFAAHFRSCHRAAVRSNPHHASLQEPFLYTYIHTHTHIYIYVYLYIRAGKKYFWPPQYTVYSHETRQSMLVVISWRFSMNKQVESM